jgi:hypothetical protein
MIPQLTYGRILALLAVIIASGVLSGINDVRDDLGFFGTAIVAISHGNVMAAICLLGTLTLIAWAVYEQYRKN